MKLIVKHPVISTITKIVLIAIPVILILLPANYFDYGQSISVFALFGVEDMAYSTGMTRSVMHLIHLDIDKSMDYNKLGIIVLPILILLWFIYLLKSFNIRLRFFKWF
jgi:hypothetical protein